MPKALTIVFAAITLSAAIPRPELPQPQFARPDWQTLNGEWEFDFDDANIGLRDNWPATKKSLSRKITVPYAFETKLSGIGDTSFHPWVWYRRTVQIPANWVNRRILLHFGAVDYRAMIWVNGRLAGLHEGGNVPIKLDITDLLTSGTQTIVVRSEDPPEDRYIPRGKQYWQPQSRGIFYTRTTGIWQPVWLEATGASFIDKLRIQTQPGGHVTFNTKIARSTPGLTLHATISYKGKQVASGSATVAGGRANIGLYVDDPIKWNIGQGNLYDVSFDLRSGANTLDRVTSYYGYRAIHLQNGRFHLNGRPIYLKMVLDQGYWMESTLTPPTDEAIQYDIKMMMEMGFNGARKHQKLEDPRFLYWADRMGFLVSSEMANAYLYDEDYAARFTREWMEAVERDVNHPSIVMWIPINESWGVSDVSDPRQTHHLKALYQLTKSLDPTRPVIDNDGWEHTDMTDLFGIHDYAPRGERLVEKYGVLSQKDFAFPGNGRSALAPGFQYNGSPVFLSEFGGIAYPLPGSPVPAGAWGYAGVEKSPEAALERMRSLYVGISKIPQIMGICYTQLTDVEQEINGLLTYDRKPKFDAKVLREINALLQ
ncbi:MAG: glycoside hydrolase family 2 [Acidobacteria bacterium]|nr:glycoside hydrolase family 2 [Acidobacteriota bacterium]